MSAELPLLILFGSQSGNAEDLSAKAAKEAKSFGIQATIKGMDEIKLEELPNYNRVLIYCSTWPRPCCSAIAMHANSSLRAPSVPQPLQPFQVPVQGRLQVPATYHR